MKTMKVNNLMAQRNFIYTKVQMTQLRNVHLPQNGNTNIFWCTPMKSNLPRATKCAAGTYGSTLSISTQTW